MNNYLEFATICISIILFIILLYAVIRYINNRKKNKKDIEENYITIPNPNYTTIN